MIAKALNAYYVDGVPVEKTIAEEKDIYSFMASQKVDQNKFTAELHQYQHVDNKVGMQKLQKINRWVITTTGGKFLKVETEEAKKERIQKKIREGKALGKNEHATKKVGLEKDSLVTIVNKVVDQPLADYNLDYPFYRSLCYDTINSIHPPMKQATLF